ncbi:RNA polymerase factor sigma-54 [Hydrogenimonas cancrithermarum]|uniref:RNA polymerase sigma-54 factor n=1 Tax=Hydrogenimonas cancrithermarum TaxID=2993563 RepID=A0ABN6WSD9_9BACT|nr:RNA polymerase factor sigma-54 [Hydrogenimonas cancrithermarum]BDY12084.1 RNA polymerase sigma-54 factor [Hydrogenimonas cancrithermarum]
MRLRQSQSVQTKTKLSNTLRSWLPILQAGLEELEEELKAYEKENPYMEVRSGFESQFSAIFTKKVLYHGDRSSSSEAIEALTVHRKSIYELLYEQINAPLFPTPLSESVAYALIEEIGSEGYFEGEIEAIAERFGISSSQVEKIRHRFAYLDPPGVGALNAPEAMLFQLRQSGVEEPIYSLVEQMLEDFENIGRFRGHNDYEAALKVIRTFKNPPAIETLEASVPIIPDLVITTTSEGIDVAINDAFYPDIHIEEDGCDHAFVRKKIKEARDLIDALQMRKATLYKIGLMIVEFQYDFFHGGDIRPMKLKDIAEEFDHNPSTISRAIANKYLMCDRGIFPMKSFFTAGIDEEVSNASIKRFITEAIASEDRNKPLSDQKLLEMIEAKFGVKMVRRTVTKYRKQMQIGGSSERKRFYRLA